MGKMILGFIGLFVIVFGIIQFFAAASGREKIQILKNLGYTTMITAMVLLIISSIIVLF